MLPSIAQASKDMREPSNHRRGVIMPTPNHSDENGPTPSECAAAARHEGVVSLLPGGEDVGLDWLDNENCTALSSTVGSEHEGAVKLILGRESVAPNRPG